MNLSEKVVDPNLNDFLNKDLSTTSERVETTGESFDVEDDKAPLSKHTKEQLLHYISKALPDIDVNKIMTMIDKIEGLDEASGKRYLEALKYASGATVDKAIVRKFIKELCNIFMNPEDKKHKKLCKNDKHVNEAVADALNSIFGQLGSLGGVLVFGLYTLASWKLGINNFSNKQIDEKKEGSIEGTNDTEKTKDILQ